VLDLEVKNTLIFFLKKKRPNTHKWLRKISTRKMTKPTF